MNINPLKELMDRKHWTWEQMGEVLGLKASSVGKMIYQIDSDRARTCMEISRKDGFSDLVDDFARLAGIKTDDKLDLADLSPTEIERARKFIYILRNPETTTAQLIPELIDNTYDLIKPKKKK